MAGKPHFGPGFEFNATMCAILYPLSLRPMHERELHRLLACPRITLARNVKRLINMGIIVRRADKKLQMVVGLMLAKTPKVGAPTFLPSGVQAMAPDGNVQRPDPDDPDSARAKPTFTAPKQEVQLPKMRDDVSDKARQLSTRMRVPARRKEGELNIGTLAKCGCGVATPFRYGVVTVCPICARR